MFIIITIMFFRSWLGYSYFSADLRLNNCYDFPRLSRSMPYFSARKISLSFTDLQHAKMFCHNKMPVLGKIILKFQGQHSYKEYSYKSKQNLLSCLLLRYVLLDVFIIAVVFFC